MLKKYYYKLQRTYFKFFIPNKSSILQIGGKDLDLIKSLKPSKAVVLNLSRIGRETKLIKTVLQTPEKMELKQKFDYIILPDTVSHLTDIQLVMQKLKQASNERTRIIFSFPNAGWRPLIKLSRLFSPGESPDKENWLEKEDIRNILELEGYDLVSHTSKILFPLYIPLLSNFINKYIANLPFFTKRNLTNFLVARLKPVEVKELSVSVIIPARNEKGNIEAAVKRTPEMGSHTEIIFIEGHSSDDTYEEIKRVAKKYKGKRDIKYAMQDGKGKGDAVRKGFDMATCDILMIQDADLTAMPEDLPKFYEAISSGLGEYVQGSRLVYPLEDEAMRFLNILGNKFFSYVFTFILRQRVKDTLCGTKVMTKENYEILKKNRAYFGDFDPFGDFDLIFGAMKMNLKFVEIPLRYQARDYGSTQISRFSHGWLLIKMVSFAMKKITFI